MRSRSFKVTDYNTNRKPDANYILSRKVFQLPRCSGHDIIAFDKAVPLVNSLGFDNLCEYRHKSYVDKNYIH